MRMLSWMRSDKNKSIHSHAPAQVPCIREADAWTAGVCVLAGFQSARARAMRAWSLFIKISEQSATIKRRGQVRNKKEIVLMREVQGVRTMGSDN